MRFESTARLGAILLAGVSAWALPWTGAPETAGAAVKTQEVEYRQGDTPLKGFLAWNDTAAGKRPGVLVVHEWWGHNQNTRNKAEALAEAGYVAFALDMFGDGKVTTHPDSAAAFVKEATENYAVMRARFDTALARLKKDPRVDPERLAAIGYCFGGMIVMNEARSGADLDAVASFHGAFPAAPPEKDRIKARILILTGGADPFDPAAQVEEVRKELKAAGADFKIVTYPGAKHAFTNPDADKVRMDALAYDESADRKSWNELLDLLRKTFP